MLKQQDLSVLAYANNFTLWHYTTTDLETTVREGNYFNKSADLLRVNDLLIVNTDTDGKPETKFLIITGNDNENVTVTSYS